MPARVILPEDIVAQPDLTPAPGEFDAIAFQDCMTIVTAYERMCHASATEESVFAPISHMVQGTKYWAKSNQDILSARILNSNLVESSTGQKIEIRSESPTGDDTFNRLYRSQTFDEALGVIKDDCVPCDTRLKLALENIPNQSTIQLYLDDIASRIDFLSQLDSLLNELSVFKDICPLLEVLNFMCIPDLQRIIAILMASMFKVNVSLADFYGLIVSLILPMIMPMLSGVVNMLDQFSILVVAPIDCVTEVIREQIQKLPDVRTRSADITGISNTPTQSTVGAGGDQGFISSSATLSNVRETSTTESLSAGLDTLHNTLVDGRNYASSKLDFYIGALKKALSDYTGDSQNYMKIAAQKLKTVQLIKLVISMIELRRRGGQLCKAGQTPQQRELDNFFQTFLNPNSFVQIAVDPDGLIRVEGPAEVLYQIEEPGEGAKILSYEPEGLLQRPAAMAFKCTFHTDPTDIDKVNKWIQELNKVSE